MKLILLPFIYIALYTIQINSEHLYSRTQEEKKTSYNQIINVAKFFNEETMNPLLITKTHLKRRKYSAINQLNSINFSFDSYIIQCELLSQQLGYSITMRKQVCFYLGFSAIVTQGLNTSIAQFSTHHFSTALTKLNA